MDEVLITEVVLPKTEWFRRSHYLKVRDRASFEFALASVAAALEIKAGKITSFHCYVAVPILLEQLGVFMNLQAAVRH